MTNHGSGFLVCPRDCLNIIYLHLSDGTDSITNEYSGVYFMGMLWYLAPEGSECGAYPTTVMQGVGHRQFTHVKLISNASC